ncbi:MAG: endonuclease MutS2 [Anaerolineae bacterium]
MDSKSAETLEFDKVLKILANYTGFSAGNALALALQPAIDEVEAVRWQEETAEAVALLESGSDITIGPTKDVREAIDRADRRYMLLTEDFLGIRDTVTAARTLRRKIEKVRETYPRLWEMAELVEECPGLVSSINKTIDDRGEVLDSASSQLAKIRREMRITHGRILERLRGMLTSHGTYLQEPIISQRGGRYVLPVRAESKGNVRGIVHDQSGSGATVWIEPMSTVDLNNDHRQMQMAEEKEIAKILTELTLQISDQGESIVRVVERMAEFDLLFAKAKYAGRINAIMPTFVPWRKSGQTEGVSTHPGSTVWFKSARHPLLDPEEVIPTNLIVPEDIFMVLITGPNTGGKTVSLKTAGLMILMAQSGMHVPCTEARLTFFENVWADIGDEQSIEQNLSTFSAHMTNMIRILDNADDRAFVVLDELGSGTDPAEGAALASAIIDFLRDHGSTVFTATHYPELKAYATSTEGVTNASLLFDLETLSPTYEMTIGLPGKSNALAIAKRLGLDNSVLDGAMGRLGIGNNETEQLLDSIYDMRERIASEEAGARLARRRAERDREKLQTRLEEIQIERDRVLKEARNQVEEELDQIRKEINRARKQVGQAESKNMLKKLGKQIDDIEQRPLASLTQTPLIDSVMPKTPKGQQPRKLRVGDTVFIKTINTKGEIISLSKTEAEIAVGRLHMRAALKEVEFRGRPVQQDEPISVPQTASPGIELDLRGMRIDEGLAKMEKHLDRAILSRVPWVRVIHGKGTGRLRDAVRQELKKNPRIIGWEEGQRGEGGAGVTIARLEKVKKNEAVGQPS